MAEAIRYVELAGNQAGYEVRTITTVALTNPGTLLAHNSHITRTHLEMQAVREVRV